MDGPKKTFSQSITTTPKPNTSAGLMDAGSPIATWYEKEDRGAQPWHEKLQGPKIALEPNSDLNF